MIWWYTIKLQICFSSFEKNQICLWWSFEQHCGFIFTWRNDNVFLTGEIVNNLIFDLIWYPTARKKTPCWIVLIFFWILWYYFCIYIYIYLKMFETFCGHFLFHFFKISIDFFCEISILKIFEHFFVTKTSFFDFSNFYF